MQTLARALKGWAGKGRPISIPFRGVQELVDFRTGDLAILAGAPGGGKSLLAINWAWRSADSILYLAQDSPRSVLMRFTALALGKRLSDIRDEDLDYWSTRLPHDKREELVIQGGAQAVADVEARIIALTEWLMEPPKLVVVDNLIDMRIEGLSHMESGFYASLLPALKQMAIAHDVGILGLHHVTRSDDHGLGDEPLKMKDLLFAGERESRHVWGAYNDGRRTINWQVLKQQDGKADPRGNLGVRLDWSPEYGTVYSR